MRNKMLVTALLGALCLAALLSPAGCTAGNGEADPVTPSLSEEAFPLQWRPPGSCGKPWQS